MSLQQDPTASRLVSLLIFLEQMAQTSRFRSIVLGLGLNSISPACRVSDIKLNRLMMSDSS